MRHVRFIEPRSGLSALALLLDDKASVSCGFLWALAQRRSTFEAIHAMWTGPEISVPIPAATLPSDATWPAVPEENATSFPEAGDIVLTYLPNGSVKDLPLGDFYDIGLFYGPGGRLLMPFGWIRANVCARIVEADLLKSSADFRALRRNGVCNLTIEAA